MAAFVSCNENSIEQLKLHLKNTFHIINLYRPVIDAYVSDFFVKDYWSDLPVSWQQYFEKLEFSFLACLLTGEPWNHATQQNRVSPLSLLSLKACIQFYSLNRWCINLDNVDILTSMTKALQPSHSTHNSHAQSQSSAATFSVPTHSAIPKFKNGQLMEMKHIFRKHVKPKKQHEIQNLSKVISWLSDISECGHVIDVGAGLGHLSRLLNFGLGLKVTTVEAADSHVPKANEYDRELEKDIQKKIKKTDGIQSQDKVDIASVDPDLLPNHVVCTVQTDITAEEFMNIIDKAESDCTSEDSCSQSFVYDQVSSCDKFHHSPHKDNDVDSTLDQFLQKNCKGDHLSTTFSHVPNISTSSSKVLPEGLVNNNETKLSSRVTKSDHSVVFEKQCLNIYRDKSSESAGDRDTESGNLRHIKRRKKEKNKGRLLLVGLHACGDLTPTLLRVFINCPAVAGLASVACCYMKLTCNREEKLHSKLSYPLSHHVQTLENHQLTYAARELACHFLDAYIRRLRDNSPHLLIHGYRAAVQYMIMKICPNFKLGTVRLVFRKGAAVPFLEYAKQCFQKLGINESDVPEDIYRTGESLVKQWRLVVAFYTLRLSLAPLVESAILLDRMLILYEQGISSILVPIFDSNLSPRNFVLLACK